jgi:hypothetical protein
MELTTMADAPALEAQIHANLRADIARGRVTLEQANQTLAGSPHKPLAAPAVTETQPNPAASSSAGGLARQPALIATSAPATTQVGGLSPKALMADSDFVARYLRKDAAAVAIWENAHKIAAGEPVAAPGALDRLNALKADPAFAEKIAAGDVAALAEWKAANRDAYPEGAAGAAAEVDALHPAAGAMDFDLTGVFTADHAGTTINTEALEAERTMRTWLADGGFDKGSGSHLAKSAAAFAPQWEKMNEEQRVQHADTVRKQLTKVCGGEQQAADRIGMARVLLLEMGAKHPTFRDTFERSGAGADLTTIVEMGMQAERLAIRKRLTVADVKAKYPQLFESKG